MRILLTNDDGVSSPGITLLAEALRKAGHRVFVIAPSSNRSGVSHAISFINGPCRIVKIDEDTWSCDGTPVDCIVIGLLGCIGETGFSMEAPPDAVLSGINKGANLGTDILYSGTAAAARQGGLAGIPSLALSLVEGEEWNWDTAVSFIVERLDEMLSCWKPGSFVNVNIPNRRDPPAALVPAFPSKRYYNDRISMYNAPDGSLYCFAAAGEIGALHQDTGKHGADAGSGEHCSDWEAVTENNASLSGINIHPVLLREA